MIKSTSLSQFSGAEASAAAAVRQTWRKMPWLSCRLGLVVSTFVSGWTCLQNSGENLGKKHGENSGKSLKHLETS